MKDQDSKQISVLVPCKTLAQMLSISQRTAWRLISADKLPRPLSVGSSIRWRLSDIELFLKCDGDMKRFNNMKGDQK